MQSHVEGGAVLRCRIVRRSVQDREPRSPGGTARVKASAPERRRDDFPIAPRAKRKGATPGVGARLDDEARRGAFVPMQDDLDLVACVEQLCGMSVYDYYW